MDDVISLNRAALVCLLLLCLVGCTSTGRIGSLPPLDAAVAEPVIEPEPLRDPFLETLAAAPKRAKEPETSPKKEAGASAPEGPPDRTLPRGNPEADASGSFAVAEAPEPEEERYRASLSEQEAVLSKDAWSRNLLLDRYLENGMKNPFPKTMSSAQRNRSAGFDRLNLSNKEQNRLGARESLEYVSGLVSTWRWFHLEMERLASVPPEERISPDVFLRSPKYEDKKYRILRANAAILLGRDGDPQVANILLEIVADKTYRVELRCAAAETLGKLPNVTADHLLPMVDRFKEKQKEIVNPQTGVAMKRTEMGIPLLWLETLYALAEKIEPWQHGCFLEPFTATVYDTRLGVAKLWRIRSHRAELPKGAALPDAFLESLRQEGGEMIRIEMIRTLGIWKTPNLLDLIGADIHRTAALRGAALDALAEADCREALPMIRHRLQDIEGANRAQAVAALRKLGCYDDVYKMHDDKDTRVRMEVVQMFAEQRNQRSADMAKRYLSENNERLQKAVLDAVALWPIEQQGEVLLEAAKGPLPTMRRRAMETLARHGVEIDGFRPEEQPALQKEKHEELVRRFQQHIQKVISGRDTELNTMESSSDSFDQPAISANDPTLADVRQSLDDWCRPNRSGGDRDTIRDRLISLGDRLPEYMQYLYETERRNIPASLDPVLAEVDPVFKAIVLLDSEKSSDFRKGASDLRRLSAVRDIGSLAVRKILDRAQRQTDSLVLVSLLETLEQIDEPAAKRLAESLLDDESAGLRKKACDVFARCGDGGDLELLIESLCDTNREVFRAALQAVVLIVDGLDAGEFEAERAEIAEVLRSRLMRDDAAGQVDVAAALHRLGDPSGTDSLRRLSASRESGVRIYVAKTIAATEDPVFVPVLMLYLDDVNGSVRKAALDGLPKLAGEDRGRIEFDHSFSGETSVTQQRVDRWKNWYENRHEAKSRM